MSHPRSTPASPITTPPPTAADPVADPAAVPPRELRGDESNAETREVRQQQHSTDEPAPPSYGPPKRRSRSLGG
ncbi:MAG TPA: hypothetical protein VHJ17_12560, partial [Thermomonospora sp.]|nr:hypothetical protein [Thermomonospora sp.]